MSSYILEAQGFGVAFGDKVILAELDFHVPATGVTVLMGPSGTGKSTLLRSLAGLNQANSRYREWGQLRLAGQPLGEGLRPALVLQNPKALGTRVFDLLAERCRQRRPQAAAELRSTVEQLLERYGCTDLAPLLQEQTIRLSTELQRCVAILVELASEPPLLMVDEPTTNLSDEGAQRVMALLERAATTTPLLLVLHNQRQTRALGQHLVLTAGGRVQANQTVASFFASPPNAVSAQFIQTGSCSLPSPDAERDMLAEAEPLPPPLPEAAQPTHPLPSPAPGPVLTPPLPPHPVAAAPTGMTAPMRAPEGSRMALLSPPAHYQPEYRGPRGFHWVLPGRLGTAPLPGVVLDIDLDLHALHTVGVTTLVTLTRRDLPQDKLAQHGLRNLHLPIYDREAPSVSQLRMLAIRMTRLLEDGEVVCVHCRAGLGRTGTVVAGWLIHEGLTAEAALNKLRTINKDYVQSDEQAQFLQQLEASFLLQV